MRYATVANGENPVDMDRKLHGTRSVAGIATGTVSTTSSTNPTASLVGDIERCHQARGPGAMKRAWLDQQLDRRNETTRSWPPCHGQVVRGPPGYAAFPVGETPIPPETALYTQQQQQQRHQHIDHIHRHRDTGERSGELPGGMESASEQVTAREWLARESQWTRRAYNKVNHNLRVGRKARVGWTGRDHHRWETLVGMPFLRKQISDRAPPFLAEDHPRV